MSDTVRKSPDELIKLEMVTKGKTFDQAFNEINTMFIEQIGYSLPRDKVAKKVLGALEKELKISEKK